MYPSTTSLNELPQSGTIDVYNKIAASYVERTLNADMSSFYDLLEQKLQPSSKLLDVGSGSGRDAVKLSARGFHVDILEPSKGLLEIFKQNNPAYSGLIYPATVQEANLPSGYYDGIYAAASLLHVAAEDWAQVLQLLHKASKPEGLMYLSVKKCPSGYDSEGRWFTGFDTASSLQNVIELGSSWRMTDCSVTNDSLGRDTIWFEVWLKA